MHPARFAVLLALGCFLSVDTARAAPQTYTLDPAHSWVQFELLHFGTSTIRGRFGPVLGSVTLDAEAGTGALGLRIPTATLSTGVPVFDARIRQADLLATEAFPEAFFVASRFGYAAGGLLEVRGEFTLRGIGQPLSLKALRYGCRPPAPFEAQPAAANITEICGGDFEAEIQRSDFGATFGLPFVGNRVRLLIQVEGHR
jgi:polyisoprenoid-binding protein YceI